MTVRPTLVMLTCWAGCTCGGRRDAATVPPAADATSPSAWLDASAAPPDVILTLTPTCTVDVPDGLAVSLSVPLAGRPAFQLADEVMGAAGTADRITDASAADRGGALPLDRRIRDGMLELVPTRDAVAPITLRYRVGSIPTAADGPREGLRHDATGLGGLGAHFLVLPASTQRHRIRVAWAPPACPATTRGAGASSFGDGPIADLVAELPELHGAVYFHGDPQRTTADVGTMRLRTAWFGAPSFDVAAAAAWAARVLAAERGFFGDDEPGDYAIFVRVLAAQGERANGVGQERSMLSAIGPRTPFGRRLKINLAHELLHRWLGLRLRLAGPEGANYWFTEGFTVHYAGVLGFRAGLISVDEFLEVINDIATRHFDNPRAAATSDQIRRDFFRDAELSIVPYTRGALYAAELDAALGRTARSLDDLMRELYRAARAQPSGPELPADAVRVLVVRELGAAGAARFDAVIERGGDPDPAADAYGPCFTRTPRPPKGFTWTRVPDIPDDACRVW